MQVWVEFLWSHPGPSPRAKDQIVEVLHDLLVAAEVTPPYILVGHSFGGYKVRYFANVYPKFTAGMVLVYVSHPEQTERLSDKLTTESYSPTDRLITTLHPEHALKHYPESLRN
jgi:pimeloyl-ACP methyl ester carboxylesterase